MTPDSQFMRAAIEEAVAGVAANHGGPFGAVLVRKGEVIASAHNRVLVDADPTAHAEMLAIRQAAAALRQHHLQGAALYTTCEPCPMCLGAIYWARIDAVYFAHTRADAARMGFGDDFIYQQMHLEITERSIAMRQAFPELAAPLAEAWGRKEDRKLY